jgi:hypothetical protein
VVDHNPENKIERKRIEEAGILSEPLLAVIPIIIYLLYIFQHAPFYSTEIFILVHMLQVALLRISEVFIA